MAGNLFGNPITDATLMAMPEFANKEIITRQDRAMVAHNQQNSENKSESARVFVEGLRHQWDHNGCTLCVVYNATGDPITIGPTCDWWGHIGESPYPQEIANGQWGAFLHISVAGSPTGSEAAVVYHGLNNAENKCDWMLAWSNPWNKLLGKNAVYTEIREPGFFAENWELIHDSLLNSEPQYTCTWNGCKSNVIIGGEDSPKFEAILTLV